MHLRLRCDIEPHEADLAAQQQRQEMPAAVDPGMAGGTATQLGRDQLRRSTVADSEERLLPGGIRQQLGAHGGLDCLQSTPRNALPPRSEEHTSALQSLMRISYAVFCLK